MLREKIAALASNLASQILAAVESATLAELIDLGIKPGPLPPVAPPKQKASARKKNAPRRRGATKEISRVDDGEMTACAIAFLTERGTRGATSAQLEAHLGDLGFTSSAHMLDGLVNRGVIRDSGFRRATGNGNATLPVFLLAE